MFSNLSNTPYIRNFQEADAHFNKTKKPPRSKKWSDNQRPLKNTSAYHYRIEKITDRDDNTVAYDVVLYQTTMARYHKPDTLGRELREYIGHDSNTSKQFMNNVLNIGYFNRRVDTTGRTVFMPVLTVPMKGSEFSTRAWFTAAGTLDVEYSQHTPLFKHVSNDQDKHLRKMIRAKFEPLLTLCAMRIPEFENTLRADYMRGGDFVSAGLRPSHKMAIAQVVRAFEMGDEPQQERVELLMELARICYVKCVSDRATSQGLVSWHEQTCSPLAIEDRVTEKDLQQAMWAQIMKHGHLKGKSGALEYPQFPEPDQIVLSNVFARSK